MNIWCDLRNIEDLAKAVGESANLLDTTQYWIKPYDRFRRKNTDWWLIPSDEWPAYRLGKGVLMGSDLGHGAVLCGLHVEKGFDPSSDWAQGYPRPEELFDRTWTWHAFMRSLALGEVDAKVREIAADVGGPLVVVIGAPVLGGVTGHPPLVRFAAEDGNLQLTATQLESTAIGALKGLMRLRDLPEAVSAIRDIDAQWIDFYIGIEISIGTEKMPAHTTKWTDADIWKRLIRPWKPWIV